MSAPPTNNSNFVCDCAERMRSACRGEGFFRQSEDKRYCVLHYPGAEKADQFQNALNRKLNAEDFDFSGVWFPEVSFSAQRFTRASFREATFSLLANFSQTVFNEYVDFRQSNFGERVDFRGARVDDGLFQYAKFVIADFTEAQFGLANFLEGEFRQANFVSAQFRGDAFFNPIRVSESTNFRSAKFVGKAFFGKADLRTAYFGEAEFATSVDFGEVQFANSNFEKARFSDRANFGEAKFGDDVVFKEALFKEADFKKAEFSGNAYFDDAEFIDEAKFEETVLTKDVLFNRTEFGRRAYFYNSRFVPEVNDNNEAGGELQANESQRTVSFESARFKDTFVFEGCELVHARLLLDSATAEQPARMAFLGVSLRPIWFMRFDVRNLQFTKVRWRQLRHGRLIAAEIKTLRQESVSTPFESLEIVSRQLAVNAEENNRYEEAARFRFVANEARRRETWHNLLAEPYKLESWKSLNPLLWLYGGVSGYGERAGQAALVLLLGWVLFAFTFLIGQESGQWWHQSKNSVASANSTSAASDLKAPMLRDLGEALLYSANVIALQKPEPLPANKRAKILVLIETLFGPVQLALLALAIRRRFMR